jgi:hypothetical protein
MHLSITLKTKMVCFCESVFLALTAAIAVYCRLLSNHIFSIIGVEMHVMGDGRGYTFNIKTDSVIPDDMYQCPFRLEAGTWHSLRLSWPSFIRTRRGKELASQHQLDPSSIIR